MHHHFSNNTLQELTQLLQKQCSDHLHSGHLEAFVHIQGMKKDEIRPLLFLRVLFSLVFCSPSGNLNMFYNRYPTLGYTSSTFRHAKLVCLSKSPQALQSLLAINRGAEYFQETIHLTCFGCVHQLTCITPQKSLGSLKETSTPTL